MTQYFLLSVVIVYHVFIHKGIPVTLLISIYVSLFSLYLYPLSVCLSICKPVSVSPSIKSIFFTLFCIFVRSVFLFQFYNFIFFLQDFQGSTPLSTDTIFFNLHNLLTIVLSFTFQSFRGTLDKK